MPDTDEDTDTTGQQGESGSLLSQLPTDRLREVAQTLLKTASDKAVGAAVEQVEGLAERLTEVADNGGTGLKAALGGGAAAAKGDNPVMGAIKGGMSAATDKIKGAFGGGGSGGGGGGGGSGKFKFMNIVEELDVGVPVRVAYDQWTQFADFPSFMKKLHTVEQESDEKTNWSGQVCWSKRTWQATITEQIPDTHVIWRSTGAKGYVNGIVSFHELAPNLTKVLLVMEYYPVGFFEKTANIWRAVGRRARLEFKHYGRHVMVHTLLEREDLEGWRGEIRDSEVVVTHEEALEREESAKDVYHDADVDSDVDSDGEDDEYGPDDEGEFYDEDEYDDGEDDEYGEYDDAEDDYDDEADEADEADDGYEADDEYEDEDEQAGDEPIEDESDEDVVDEADDRAEADAGDDEAEPDEGRRAGSRRRARAGARG